MPFSVALGVLLSGGSVIDLDGTVVVQLLVFFLTFLVLRTLVFKPVMELFDARDEAVAGGKQKAQKVQDEAEQKRLSFEEGMRNARQTAQQEAERLRGEAQGLARQLAEKSRQDSEKLLSEAKTKLETEGRKVREDVQSVVPGLARQIAGKMLGREVS